MSQEDNNLRDIFAGLSMDLAYKFWMHDYYKLGLDDGETEKGFYKNMSLVAETAYKMADAMLEARTQKL
jgi:hypothetical protein